MRIANALSKIALRKQQLSELQSVEDAVVLRAEFDAERRVHLTRLANAENDLTRESSELERVRQKLKELVVPEKLLSNESSIELFTKQLGQFLKAERDLPKLKAEASALEENARSVLRELGYGSDLECAERLRLTLAQKQKINELIMSHGNLFATLANAERRLKSSNKIWKTNSMN